MSRGRGLLVAATLLAVTACSPARDDPPPEAATVIPDDQQFTLDDQAQFPDGLEVEIAGSFAQQAPKNIQGAESSGGHIVLASVRVENNTTGPYDPAEIEVTARYGGGPQLSQQVAPPVTDPTKYLVVDFEGVVAAGDEGVAAVGFAIPTSGLAKVTFVVDLHDDVHDPVSFSGQVERAPN